MLVLVAACTGKSFEPESRNARASVEIFELIARVVTSDLELGVLARPRDGAFTRAASSETEDEESRGRIVSEGWRSTKEHRFSDLGARLPDAADGVLDVGLSRFANRHIHVTLADATSVAGILDHGRVVYPNAMTSVDRVILSNASAVEELLVLRDARAPRSFVWTLDLPPSVARVSEQRDGAFVFQDAQQRPLLFMAPPKAFDGSGKTVALTTNWSQSDYTLTIALRDEPASLTYPVVIDPRYETSTWVLNKRQPPARSDHAIVFDTTRNELMTFGGIDTTSELSRDTWVIADGDRAWTERKPAVSPTGRWGIAMAFDSARAEAVLFGGSTGALPSDETWTWSGAAWTQRAPASAPSSRRFHAMVFDAARSEVVLFGGVGFAIEAGTLNNFDLDDTWAWNGAAWALKPTAVAPSKRHNHAMAFDTVRQEVVLFGGAVGVIGPETRLQDTWIWNGSVWAQRTPASRPSSRSLHSLTFDPVRNETVLFGGRSGTNNSAMNDTWGWNGTSWTQRKAHNPLSAAPPPLVAHAAGFDPVRGRVVVFAGYDLAGGTDSVWEWNGTAWTQRVGPPSRRYFHSMVFDRGRSEIVLFGGVDAAGSVGDTWVWSGMYWERRSPATSPTPRRAHSLVYDTTRGEVLLFGGLGQTVDPAPETRLDDTWTWNGLTWTQHSPTHVPPSRSGHMMSDDAAHGQVVMFGGLRQLGPPIEFFDDTWTWDGTDWTEHAPATKPRPRFRGSIGYDERRREVLLFGGVADSLTTFLQDTWIWTGTTWTQRVTTNTPPPRGYQEMTFDPIRNELVMFAGADSGRDFRDTWIWNGETSTWLERFPGGAIGGRNAFSLAFDRTRQELVAFGGYFGAGGILQDTWINTTLGGSCTANAECSGANAFCTDGVCCNVSACGTCQTCAGVTPGKCNDVLNAEDSNSCALASAKSCSATAECKAALGVAATNAIDCASGFLVDGVCCESAACGLCDTCDIAKKEIVELPGRCGAARAGSDPRSDCTDEGSTTCGANGACNGRGACELYKPGTGCGTSVCVGSRATGQICSGSGRCDVNPRGIECAPFACRENAGCLQACASKEECAPLHRCENGACVVDQGVTCEDARTLLSATGERVDCGDYRCEGGACRTTCVTSSDCNGSADCSSGGRCVPFIERPVSSSGCAVGSAGGDPNCPFAFPLGAFVFVVAARRRVASRRRDSASLRTSTG